MITENSGVGFIIKNVEYVYKLGATVNPIVGGAAAACTGLVLFTAFIDSLKANNKPDYRRR